MNEFISPHQNININISYNLGQQQKMPKVVFGKKIAKIVKSSVKDNPDILYKTFKKNSEHVIPVQQVKKASTMKNKTKKKKENNLSIIPDQEIIQPRRLKTEGNSRPQTANFTSKKQSKNHSKALSKGNKQHSKSVNNPPANQNVKTLQIKKPVTNVNKMKKQQRRNYNKSCILYQPKKNLLLSDIEHIVSTTTSGPTPTNKQIHKKRVNSVNVMRSDKFITKLLDMSVLTSQLGGSIPMHDQNSKNHQNTNNRIKNSLQEYMNSMDLKIIKEMKKDQQKKSFKTQGNIGMGVDIITYLNKIRRIPLQKLHEKARKIQKFWRKKTTQSIIPYYSNMFFKNPAINSKAAIEQNLNQISGIDVQLGDGEQFQDNHDSLVRSQKNKNVVKRQIFQYVSVVKVSSSQKPDFEEESISVTKINRMLEYGSAVRQPIYDERDDMERLQYEEGQEQHDNESEQQDSDQQEDHEQIQNEGHQQLSDLEEDHNGQQSQGEQEEEEGKSLNIQKYKQLVRQSIQKNKRQAQKQQQLKNLRNLDMPKQIIKSQQSPPQHSQHSKHSSKSNGQDLTTQSAHWNHVHNILSSNMNKKTALMSKTVLQQLMKQSAYNKQWVQGQFSNQQSRKMSQKSSPREHRVQVNKQQLQLHKNNEQQQLEIKNKQKSKHKIEIQKILSQQLQNLNKQQYKFTSKSSRQDSSKINNKQQQQDDKQCEYNWNKYSDISKLKKPQQIMTKKQQKGMKNEQLQMINMKIANIEQIQKMMDKNEEYDKQYNRQQKNDMSGLLPSGLKHNSLYCQQQQISNDNKHRIQSKEEPNAQYQESDDNDSLNDDINGQKDQKWIRQQMIMQDGIVQKYLDCGLDSFGLNFHKNINKNQVKAEQIHNNSIQPTFNKPIQQLQQQAVQEQQQHQAKLQKQHKNPKNIQKQQKITKFKQLIQNQQNNNKEDEHDDIFSSDQQRILNSDDQQLVYVFNNIHKDKDNKDKDKHFDRDIALEHAVKNSKRKDNQYHLGYRPQDVSIINQFVNADYSINKLRQQKQQQLKNNKNIQYSPGSQQEYPSIVQKQSQKIPLFQLFEPAFNSQPISLQNNDLSAQQLAIKQQINTKRVQKITQTIIAKLIQQFAYDVSVILRKTQQSGTTMIQTRAVSQGNRRFNTNQLKQPIPPVSAQNGLANSNANLGILTNFQNIRDFIIKLKQYILGSQEHSRKVVENLRNNIGPTSMEILSYLRIDQPNQYLQNNQLNAQQQQNKLQEQQDNQQWLFVIPNDLFQVFNKKLLDEEQQKRSKKLSNRFKLYTQFWHRSIFECYNQCLDFQRPYGITGAPYAWIVQPKLPHQIKYSKQKVKDILQNAQNRLLELSCSSSGIIFDKPESPYKQFQLNQQHKIQLNQQKISRMLANEILDDQYNWITYNDQMTELMVDISRKIEELLLFQVSTDIKKIMRRRKMMIHVNKNIKNQQKQYHQIDMDESSDGESQHVVFMVEDLL